MSSSWNFMCLLLLLLMMLVIHTHTHTHILNKCIPLTVLTFQNYSHSYTNFIRISRAQPNPHRSDECIGKIYIFQTVICGTLWNKRVQFCLFVLLCLESSAKWKRKKNDFKHRFLHILYDWKMQKAWNISRHVVPIFWKWWFATVFVAYAMNKFADIHAWSEPLMLSVTTWNWIVLSRFGCSLRSYMRFLEKLKAGNLTEAIRARCDVHLFANLSNIWNAIYRLTQTGPLNMFSCYRLLFIASRYSIWYISNYCFRLCTDSSQYIDAVSFQLLQLILMYRSKWIRDVDATLD